MGSIGCRETVEWFTATQAEDAEFRAQLRSLLRAEEPNLEGVAALISAMEPTIGALVAAELLELPRPATLAILRAWTDAVDLALPFRLVSEPPMAPLRFARSRLVRVVVDLEESGVTVRLSHVPGRHPAWHGRFARGTHEWATARCASTVHTPGVGPRARV